MIRVSLYLFLLFIVTSAGIAQVEIYNSSGEPVATVGIFHGQYPYLDMDTPLVTDSVSYSFAVRNDRVIVGLITDNRTGAILEEKTITEKDNFWIADCSDLACMAQAEDQVLLWKLEDNQVSTFNGRDGGVPQLVNEFLVVGKRILNSHIIEYHNLESGTITVDTSRYMPRLSENFSASQPFCYDRQSRLVKNCLSGEALFEVPYSNSGGVRLISNDSLIVVVQLDRIIIYNYLGGQKETFDNVGDGTVRNTSFTSGGAIQSPRIEGDRLIISYYGGSDLRLLAEESVQLNQPYSAINAVDNYQLWVLSSAEVNSFAYYDPVNRRLLGEVSGTSAGHSRIRYTTDDYIYIRLSPTQFLRWDRRQSGTDTITVPESWDWWLPNSSDYLIRQNCCPEAGAMPYPESTERIHIPYQKHWTLRPSKGPKSKTIYRDAHAVLLMDELDPQRVATAEATISDLHHTDDQVIFRTFDRVTVIKEIASGQQQSFYGNQYQPLASIGYDHYLGRYGDTLYHYRDQNLSPVLDPSGNPLPGPRSLMRLWDKLYMRDNNQLLRLDGSQAQVVGTYQDVAFAMSNGCGMQLDSNLFDPTTRSSYPSDLTIWYDEDHCLSLSEGVLTKYDIRNFEDRTIVDSMSNFPSQHISWTAMLGRYNYRYLFFGSTRFLVVDTSGSNTEIDMDFPCWPTSSAQRLDNFYYWRKQDSSGYHLMVYDTELGHEIDLTPDGMLSPPLTTLHGQNHAGVPYLHLGDSLFFAAYHPDHGEELWFTDGTVAGTQLLFDLTGDQLSSLPNHFTYSEKDHTLYWSGQTAAGQGLFAYGLPSTTSTINTPAQGNNRDQLAVYPNPCTDFVRISEELSPKLVQIYNLSGQLVYSSNRAQHDVNVRMLVPGTYLLRVLDHSNTIHQCKIIKL